MYRAVYCFLCTALLFGPDVNMSRAEDQAAEDQPVENNAEAQAEESPELALMVIEKNIVAHTNAQRKRHGLPPLVIDEGLVHSARGHAIWMARSRALQHTRKAVAENIAMGYRSSREAVSGWMNSSGHRANILNPSHRRIGVAAYEAHNGAIYWCQQFLR